MFQKAVKSQSKLRMSITGPSGSGKTYTSLAIATALGRVAMVDTENRSASKYADEFDFDVLEMDAPFHPDRFIEAIDTASKAGYDVVVIDSLSHAWNGAGGLLEIVDQIGKRMKTSNTFAAWKDATPIQNRLVEAIVRAKIHIIAAMRSKQEYVIEQVEKDGRTISVPRKVGTAPVQRDSFEYEFDIVGDMDMEHNLVIQKTRCKALDNGVFSKPGADIAGILTTWLSDGAEPTETPPVFNSINDLLHQIYTDFGLSESETKIRLKELGYKAFKRSQSADMYRAVADWVNTRDETELEADQLGFDTDPQPGAGAAYAN